MNHRAQSESIGVILLTAVIVILVGGFGVVYLGAMDDGGQDPLVDAEVNATDEWVSITHGGGESLAVAELEVVLRSEGASERYAVDAANVTGGGDGSFDPGDRYRRDHGLGNGSMEVLLIHTGSNAVVHEAHLDAVGSETSDGSEPPATFGHAPSNPTVGETVTFDAGSPAVDDVVSYDWDWDGDGIVENSSTDPVVEHAFDASGTHEVTLSVVADDGATNRTTRTVVVGPNPPSIEGTTLTDGDDDLVGSGDSVSVSATVDPGSGAVDAVVANASAFDAGNVTLSDGDGDGIYDGTIDVGPSATEGAQSVAISVTDTNGNGEAVTTDDEVVIDTTAPEIDTLDVSDNSYLSLSWSGVNYIELFDIQWTVTDVHPATSTITVNLSGSTQETYRGFNGDVGYENVREGEWSGREHTITIVAVDEAGNRACRTVTDTADDSDPPESAYEAC